jgi:hypothetical protein
VADHAARLIDPLPDGACTHLGDSTTGHVLKPGCDYRTEFEYRLDLDALEQRVQRCHQVAGSTAR